MAVFLITSELGGNMGDELELSEQDRLQYSETAYKQSLEFDSRVLWFSGGGLVAILAFAGALEDRPSIPALVSVSLGAVLLLSASGLTLYSFQRSARDIASFLDHSTEKSRKKQLHDMQRLNLCSLRLLLGGLLLLGLFAVFVMASK